MIKNEKKSHIIYAEFKILITFLELNQLLSIIFPIYQEVILAPPHNKSNRESADVNSAEKLSHQRDFL